MKLVVGQKKTRADEEGAGREEEEEEKERQGGQMDYKKKIDDSV